MHKSELDRFGVSEAELMLASPQATHYARRLMDAVRMTRLAVKVSAVCGASPQEVLAGPRQMRIGGRKCGHGGDLGLDIRWRF